MSQTSVSTDPAVAVPGMDADIGNSNIISRINGTQQLDLVTIAGNDDGTFTITIDGTQEATFTASSDAATVIAADLLADMASPTAAVTAEAGTTIQILIEGTTRAFETSDDSTFVTTVASSGTSADITVSTLVPQNQELPYGVGVVMDPRAATSAKQCRLPRLTGEITAGTFLGITRYDSSREANAGNGYTNQSDVSILRYGRIYVRVEDAVVEGGDVFCRFTDPTTAYALGSFRSDADSDAVAIPGAMYMSSASADGLAIVELNPTT